MILVYLIVGILNSIGLMALGVRHAILFGMLCAIMTIIPYAGIIVSALLPITVVWLDTSNIWYPVGVIALFSVVQYLEANVIFPRVVGVSLGVSTFAILVSIIAGRIVWRSRDGAFYSSGCNIKNCSGKYPCHAYGQYSIRKKLSDTQPCIYTLFHERYYMKIMFN